MSFDEYTAEQLQEADQWWEARGVTLPSPYHSPRQYLYHVQVYHLLYRSEQDSEELPQEA